LTRSSHPVCRAAKKPDALIDDYEPLSISKRAVIVAFAADDRIPAVYGARDFAEVSRPITYGPSVFDIWRRAPSYIDKILKGTKPADLPVQQPTTFEQVINLKNRKSGRPHYPAIDPSAADEVIE
jgi:putative tryptophan/tyrosine transport system substrate-binding protein